MFYLSHTFLIFFFTNQDVAVLSSWVPIGEGVLHLGYVDETDPGNLSVYNVLGTQACVICVTGCCQHMHRVSWTESCTLSYLFHQALKINVSPRLDTCVRITLMLYLHFHYDYALANLLNNLFIMTQG